VLSPFKALPIGTSVDTVNDRLVFMHWNGSTFVDQQLPPKYLTRMANAIATGLVWSDTLPRHKALATNYYCDSLFKPGGSNNSVQFNNNGAFGGFWQYVAGAGPGTNVLEVSQSNYITGHSGNWSQINMNDGSGGNDQQMLFSADGGSNNHGFIYLNQSSSGFAFHNTQFIATGTTMLLQDASSPLQVQANNSTYYWGVDCSALSGNTQWTIPNNGIGYLYNNGSGGLAYYDSIIQNSSSVTWNRAGGKLVASTVNNGTVTNVAMTVPSGFSISGSPITSSGTLGLTYSTETAHYALLGPTGGSAATPTWRPIYSKDISGLTDSTSHSWTLTTTGTSGAATYSGNVLNIPVYAGTVTSIATGYGLTGGTITTTGTLKIDSTQGNLYGSRVSSQYAWYHYINAIFAGSSNITTVGTLTTGATGSGFTVALASSTITGTLSTTNGGLGANEGSATGVVQMSSGSTSVSTALANATTATTQSFGDASTDVSTDAYAEGINPEISALRALGSTIQDQTLECKIKDITTSNTLNSGTCYFFAIYIPRTQTITGINFYMATTGIYTTSHYNGVALYSYSAGTMTLVDSTTRSSTVFKATVNTTVSAAFPSTYSASRGVYYVAILYSQSAVTTPPAFGSPTSVANIGIQQLNFTNSATLAGDISGQTALPTTQTMSGLTGSTPAIIWFGLY